MKDHCWGRLRNERGSEGRRDDGSFGAGAGKGQTAKQEEGKKNGCHSTQDVATALRVRFWPAAGRNIQAQGCVWRRPDDTLSSAGIGQALSDLTVRRSL